MYDYDNGFPPYVSVAERKREAAKLIKILRKKDKNLSPIQDVPSRGKIAKSFWGHEWCRTIESYRDLEYRLERGRSYLRSGAVVDLRILRQKVVAKVKGSELYDVEITFTKLPKATWKRLTKKCAGEIGSLVELLTGQFSKNIMSQIASQESGLFPTQDEIAFNCNCPDYATVCKHVAAALYGIGVRFDEQPDLFFLLRGVDPQDLVSESAKSVGSAEGEDEFSADEIGNLFGIEVEAEAKPAKKRKTRT